MSTVACIEIQLFISPPSCLQLKATEFLNLDAILEDVLVRLVLRPLWTHINKLFVEAYTASGSIQLLATNMKYARTQPTSRLGVRVSMDHM